jgi:ABC-2 type transport system permease protein
VSAGSQGRVALVQFAAMFRKELRQTVRDRRIMMMLIAAPLIQTVVFGYAVDFDVDRVKTVVSDLDRTAESREQARRLLADGTLVRAAETTSAAEVDRLLDTDRVSAALVFPAGFGADMLAGRTARVQVVIDGSDPVRAGTPAAAALRYFGEAALALGRTRLAAAGLRVPSVEVRPRVLYNPRLKTAVYIVPGIMAMLLVVVTTVVTSMGLSREREMGTLEQVLVTPIRPSILLAGKMSPFVLIGLFDIFFMLVAISWIFGVPVRGPLAVLALGALLYLCSTLGVGLLISTMSQTQQQSFLGGILFVMPAALLSVILTPIRAMPPWLRAATYLNPLRFFAEVVRGVLLRGSGLADLWPQLAVLFVFGVLILGSATMRFRARLG